MSLLFDDYIFKDVSEHRRHPVRELVIPDADRDYAKGLSKFICTYLKSAQYSSEIEEFEDDGQFRICIRVNKLNSLDSLLKHRPAISIRAQNNPIQTAVRIHPTNGLEHQNSYHEVDLLEDLISNYAENPSSAKHRVNGISMMYDLFSLE